MRAEDPRIVGTSSLDEQVANRFVMAREHVSPASIPQGRRLLGRTDDVGEEKSREHAIRLRGVSRAREKFLDLVKYRIRIADEIDVVGSGECREPSSRNVACDVARLVDANIPILFAVHHQGRHPDRRQDVADIGFRVAPALEPVREKVLAIVEQLEEFQVSAAKELGIDDEGVPFHVKKEVTSALRRLAPTGLSTDIIWTANVRTLRHVVEMRTAPGAEEELRLVFDRVAAIMQAEAPGLFQDFARHADGAWVPQFHKV